MSNIVKVICVSEYSDGLLKGLVKLLADLHPRVGSELTESKIKVLIDSPDRALFVAKANVKIVATATLNTIYGVTSNRAWLRDFAVAKEMRRKGIGSALWGEVIKWCNDRNMNLLLSTNKDNIEAQKFYRSKKAQTQPNVLFSYKAE